MINQDLINKFDFCFKTHFFSCSYNISYRKFKASFFILLTLSLINSAFAVGFLDLTHHGQDTLTVKYADELFARGDFKNAQENYLKLEKQSLSDIHVAKQLAYLALLSNRLVDAEKLYRVIIKNSVKDSAAIRNLAEVYYRQGKMKDCARMKRLVGLTGRAELLESFGDQPTYDLLSKEDSTVIKFISTDPLPVVEIIVNGIKAFFIIDTGGADIVLDPEFAAKLNIKIYGSSTGTYAGGKTATSKFGILDTLQLGKYVIKNVPVQLLNSKQFSSVVDKPIDGVIGTVLLYHFLSSLDYPHQQLILRKNDTHNYKIFSQTLKRSKKAVFVPFWMAADHLMVLHGAVNNFSTLFIVDTGLAGAGFTCPQSTMTAAHILIDGKEIEGIGGGGKVKASAFVTQTVSITNELIQNNVPGYFGIFPAFLENSFGFHVGGLISHTYLKQYELTFDFKHMQCVFVR